MTKEPSRIKVEDVVVKFNSWDIEHSLKEVQELISHYIKMYGEDAYIKRVYDMYDDSVMFGVCIKRPETDKEYAKRCELTQLYEDRELQQYLSLKQKYEGRGDD